MQYADKFALKWGDEYELLSSYMGSAKNVSIKHKACGNEYEKKASEALRYGCAACSRKANQKKSLAARYEQNNITQAFIHRLRTHCGEQYTLMGKYKDAKTNVELQCSCGRSLTIRPDDLFYNGRGCDCGAREKVREERRKTEAIKMLLRKKKDKGARTHEDYAQEVKDIWGDEFLITGSFVDMSTKVEVVHSRCGRKYMKDPYSLIRNHGCFMCSRSSMSSGVIIISSVLESLGIEYSREVKPEGCRHIKQLSFDFGVYSNGQLISFIEYDGEQHFRQTQRYGGQAKLDKVRARDAAKDSYCEDKGIPLLRIDYKTVERSGKRAREQVEKILKSFIKSGI